VHKDWQPQTATAQTDRLADGFGVYQLHGVDGCVLLLQEHVATSMAPSAVESWVINLHTVIDRRWAVTGQS
jgi:hypothetical protein